MSHVPFVAIAPEADAESSFLPSIPNLDANDLRDPSDRTAVGTSSTSATSILADRMSSRRGPPTWLGLPVAVITSMGISAAANNFLPTIAGYDMAPVSRSLNGSWQIGGLVAWKIARVVFAWTAGLDCKLLFPLLKQCTRLSMSERVVTVAILAELLIQHLTRQY